MWNGFLFSHHHWSQWRKWILCCHTLWDCNDLECLWFLQCLHFVHTKLFVFAFLCRFVCLLLCDKKDISFSVEMRSSAELYWRTRIISRGTPAHKRNVITNNDGPSSCVQMNFFSASALFASSFHLVPLLFTFAAFCTRFPTWSAHLAPKIFFLAPVLLKSVFRIICKK
jgi:hypothetical protein